ncbi:MAG: protein kinase [Deltaproteobacteria bacterium]|nr:protein kinase [Deltaproteobacteria bacterium]
MPAPASVKIGDLVAGKYRIDRVLGEGGMGLVLAATHLDLDERVALKVMHDDVAAAPELVERFMREAKAAAKIKSDHVARVTDFGRLDSGSSYLVMEYLEGEDVEKLLAREGPLPIPRAVELLLQACEAIGEAHSRGIVHRDLKPANLFITRQPDGSPFVKVLDFGISKMHGHDDQPSLTQTGAALGSPLYMAPEQMLQSKDVDARCDVWACGVVLFEMLTGRAPFEGTTIAEISARIAATPHTPIRSLRPEVPEPLAALIDKALAKQPRERIPSVAALARALLPYADGEGAGSVRRIEATALASDPSLVPPPHTLSSASDIAATVVARTEPSFSEPTAPPRSTARRGAALFAISALATIAVASLVVVFVTSKKATPAVEAAPPASAPTVIASATLPPEPPALSATTAGTEHAAAPVPSAKVDARPLGGKSAAPPRATSRPAAPPRPDPPATPTTTNTTPQDHPFDSRK